MLSCIYLAKLCYFYTSYDYYAVQRVDCRTDWRRIMTESHLPKPFPSSTKDFQQLYYAVDNMITALVVDRYGIITYANESFCKIAQYNVEELIGTNYERLFSTYHDQLFFTNIRKAVQQDYIWQGEICSEAKDNSLFWLEASVSPIFNEYGRLIYYVAVFTDVMEQRNIAAVTKQANHDSLTGLPSRKSLQARIENEMEYSTRNGQAFAVFDMDINRFKSINDGLGHTIGDQFLIEVSERLMSIDPIGNSFYRQGADEFAFILTDLSQLDTIALKIMDQFKKPFVIDGHKFYSSVSIGIAKYPAHATDAESLMNNADVAMLLAKERKGNNYFVFNASLEAHEMKDITLETKLYDALRLEQLALHYQPKIDIATGKLIGMEALLRWHDEELGFIPPDRFIPFAEETGLIIPIGEWVLQRACLDVKGWNDLFDLNLRVAVNFSPIQLALPNIIEMIQNVLHSTNVDPSFVEIEITEMSMVDFNDQLMEKLAIIREMGITISIDDFGTGYSSLSYLKNLPVDTLKIDRAFIMEIGTSETNTNLVGAIIHLAHAMNLSVVAEGVEREEEWAYLKSCGCEQAQGYYFSRPLSPDLFFQYVLTQP